MYRGSEMKVCMSADSWSIKNVPQEVPKALWSSAHCHTSNLHLANHWRGSDCQFRKEPPQPTFWEDFYHFTIDLLTVSPQRMTQAENADYNYRSSEMIQYRLCLKSYSCYSLFAENNLPRLSTVPSLMIKWYQAHKIVICSVYRLSTYPTHCACVY